jgi:serine/threonine protein kinase
MWSLGIVVYELVVGRYPYPASSKNELQEIMRKNGDASPRNYRRVKATCQPNVDYASLIRDGHVPTLPPTHFGRTLVDFVEKCLEREASRRLTFEELEVL